MRKITSMVSLAILLSAANVKADVIYQLIETGTGDVRATLDFDSTVFGASATSGWTAPQLALSSLLEGGISGFMIDFGFGAGLEGALSGDFTPPPLPSWTSIDGSTLNSGAYLFGTVNYMTGAAIGVFDFGIQLEGDDPSISGVWRVQTRDETMPVPEPTTLWLFGLGLAGLGIHRRKLNAHS